MDDAFVQFYNAYIATHPNDDRLDLFRIVRKFAAGIQQQHFTSFGQPSIPVRKLVPNPRNITNPSNRCGRFRNESNGRVYFFTLDQPDRVRKRHVKVLERLSTLNKLWTDGNFLSNAPAGAYTYFIGDSTDGRRHIYALQTFSSHEVGSKHCQILNRITRPDAEHPLVALDYAGEVKISVNEASRAFEFNILSGSYMKPYYEEYEKEHGKDGLQAMIAESVRDITAWFASQGMSNIRHNDVPLFVDLVTPIEAIILYVSLGIRMYLFNDVQSCDEFKRLAREGRGHEAEPEIVDSILHESLRLSVEAPPVKKRRKREESGGGVQNLVELVRAVAPAHAVAAEGAAGAGGAGGAAGAVGAGGVSLFNLVMAGSGGRLPSMSLRPQELIQPIPLISLAPQACAVPVVKERRRPSKVKTGAGR